MSTPYFRPSTPSLDTTKPKAPVHCDSYFDESMGDADADFIAGTFTEARSVVQQHKTSDGSLDCMFTLELSKDKETIVFKAFDEGIMTYAALSYETANALQVALSDLLDDMEENMSIND